MTKGDESLPHNRLHQYLQWQCSAIPAGMLIGAAIGICRNLNPADMPLQGNLIFGENVHFTERQNGWKGLAGKFD